MKLFLLYAKLLFFTIFITIVYINFLFTILSLSFQTCILCVLYIDEMLLLLFIILFIINIINRIRKKKKNQVILYPFPLNTDKQLLFDIWSTILFIIFGKCVKTTHISIYFLRQILITPFITFEIIYDY